MCKLFDDIFITLEDFIFCRVQFHQFGWQFNLASTEFSSLHCDNALTGAWLYLDFFN